MKYSHYDVIVVGAGMIGSTFALLLAKQAGLSIAVVERGAGILSNQHPNQRVVALGHVATDALDRVGVLAALDDESRHPYKRMFVWDQNTDGELDFNASEYQQGQLGYIIDALQCTALLQQELERTPNIDVFYNFSAKQLCLEQSEASLLGDKSALTAQLLVAADGNRSWVRQQAKIFAPEHAYDQQAIVAKITTEASHDDTAWQRFLTTGPLAVLPLSNNRSSIVWSADTQYAETLMSLPAQDFADAVADALENRLGAVSLLSRRAAFPLKSQHAQSYYKHRLALIGDAAHSIHPLAGQGANLGFKDAVSLAGILLQVQVNSLGELPVLAKYQRARSLDNRQTDFLMTALYRAYRADMSVWLALRGIGMSWLGRSATIKQILARQAMGR